MFDQQKNKKQTNLGSEEKQRETIRRAQQPNVQAQEEMAEAQPVIDGK